MKKVAGLFLALIMCSLLCVPAFAEDFKDASSEFVSLTREEYISQKAARLGISYEEAEALVDENINNTLSMVPMATDGFEATGGSTDEYGVNTAYGYIVYTKVIPNTDSMMKVRMSSYAVIISGPPGRYISEVETPSALPGSSGEYTINASCNVSLASNKQSATLSASGNAEITQTYAVEMGLSDTVISFGQSFGTTSYLRYPFTVGATYRV